MSTIHPPRRPGAAHGWARELRHAGSDAGRTPWLRRRHPSDMPVDGYHGHRRAH